MASAMESRCWKMAPTRSNYERLKRYSTVDPTDIKLEPMRLIRVNWTSESSTQEIKAKRRNPTDRKLAGNVLKSQRTKAKPRREIPIKPDRQLFSIKTRA